MRHLEAIIEVNRSRPSKQRRAVKKALAEARCSLPPEAVEKIVAALEEEAAPIRRRAKR